MKTYKFFGLLTILALLIGGLPVMSAGAASATLYVDAGGSCGGILPCYLHPQDAVNAANPGDTILVYPGTYDSRYSVCNPTHPTYCSQNDNWAPALIVYKDDLTIRSVEGPASTIIQSTHNFWSNAIAVQNSTDGGITGISGWSPNAITVVANNVMIDGFTLHRPYEGTWATWNTAGVLIGSKASGYADFLGYANGATVQNNIFSDVWHAVYIWHSSDNKILNNTVEALGNTGHWAAIESYDGWDNASVALQPQSTNNVIANNILADKGIGLGASAPSIPTDNSGTKIIGNTVHGKIEFYYSASSGVEIIGNTLPGPSAGLIRLNNTTSCTSCVVEENTVGAGSGNGMVLNFMTGGSLSGNNVSDRTANGIALLYSSGVAITGNTTTDNGASGVVLVNTSNVIVSGNKILSNAGNVNNPGGLTIGEGAATTTVTDNTINNNTQFGVWISPTAGTGNVFHLNNIVANGMGMLNNLATVVDAENNWWGDPSGPYNATSNAAGIGNGVNDSVDFNPWITGLVYTGDTIFPNTVQTVLKAKLVNSDGNGLPAPVPGVSVEFFANNDSVGTVMTDANGVAELVVTLPTGVYNVRAVITGGGLLGDCLKNLETTALVAVYDPTAGFVTGGGWIDSPAGAYLPDAYHPGPEIIVVTPQDVGVSWFSPDLRGGGYVDFVEGPDTLPLGIGSLEMGSTSGSDKAQLFSYGHIGTPLADIDALTYATYRHITSTNSVAQYPAINMEVDYVGDGSSYTTLVWEPIYAYGQLALAEDTWQTWDTMAPSQTSFGGGWWSTRSIPGVCSFDCFVSWDTVLQNNPNAKIVGAFGVNIGSGWSGLFTGNVDALSLTVNGDSITYDYEPVSPSPNPTGKATFGFVSKYKKGATVPEGNTEFQFKAGDLNFSSTSYEWLVVTGSNFAKFKGAGAINGAGDYKFQLWAGDGTSLNGLDTFRIKIWYEDNGSEVVVYDNGMDQEIGGGSIVVHKAK